MMWPDLAARARGLSSRLLSVDDLDRIDRAGGLDGIARELARCGYGTLASPPTADVVDLAIRKRSAVDLATLARWAGERSRALAVVFDDQDRRVLRTIVRGIAGHVPASRRLAGAVSTPALPERALPKLAEATSIAELAAGLRRLGHPYADVMVAAAATDEPVDVFSIETALARCFATRARRAIGGSRALRRLVEQITDVDNVSAALLLSARGDDTEAADSFLRGGARLDIAGFIGAAGSVPERARAQLAKRFARSPIGTVLAAPGEVPELETAALDWHLQGQSELRRVEPLGAAPIIWLVLSRRREARRIRKAAWRAALGGST